MVEMLNFSFLFNSRDGILPVTHCHPLGSLNVGANAAPWLSGHNQAEPSSLIFAAGALGEAQGEKQLGLSFYLL